MKLRICCDELKRLTVDGWARGGEVYSRNSETGEETSEWSLWIEGNEGETITNLSCCPSCGYEVEFIRDIKEEVGNVLVGISSHPYYFGDSDALKYLVMVRNLDSAEKSEIGVTDDYEEFYARNVRPYGLRFMGFNHIPFADFKVPVRPSEVLADHYEREKVETVAVNVYGYAENLHGELVDMSNLRRE